MKRIVVLGLAALALCVGINNAFAQEDEWLRIPYRFTISLEGGIGMPLKPAAFNDLWNASFPVSIAFGYVVVPYVEVRGWLTYATWGISEIPAKDAIGIGGVTETTGGSITTMLYGGSAKIIPFPKSRLMPYVEFGGGYFQASGDGLVVTQNEVPIHSNAMDDASGPAFLAVFGMEYGINERWNAFAEIDYYAGFDDTFSPGNLVLGPNEDPVEGGSLNIATVVLGIVLKI
jgi:hypothetical protein